MTTTDADRTRRKLIILQGIIERLLALHLKPFDVLERKLCQMEDLIADFSDDHGRNHGEHFFTWKETITRLWEQFCCAQQNVEQRRIETKNDGAQTTAPKTIDFERINDNQPQSSTSSTLSPPTTTVPPSTKPEKIRALKPENTTASYELSTQLQTRIDALPSVSSTTDLQGLLALSTLVHESFHSLKPHLSDFDAQLRIINAAIVKLPAELATKYRSLTKHSLKRFCGFLSDQCCTLRGQNSPIPASDDDN